VKKSKHAVRHKKYNQNTDNTKHHSQVRREIIQFINEKEKVGFNDLQEKFKLKVGSLYHQLNSMKELLLQDENKKYSLSNLGKVAYDLMILNKDHIAASNVKIAIPSDGKTSFGRKILQGITFIFLPKRIFQYLSSEPIRTFFEGLIVIGLMLYFSIDSQTILAGFYPLKVDYWYFSLISILGLWIFLALILESLFTLFYKRKFQPIKLVVSIPFTLIPCMLALFFIWLQTKIETIFLFLDGQILIIIAQIWSLALVTTAVNQAKELTMNRSSFIVLFTFYFIYAISFVIASLN
ncbi:MAG: hypothetical protein ACFFDW_13075, partial [Candidatus Thorarchaeota archaeon]